MVALIQCMSIKMRRLLHRPRRSECTQPLSNRTYQAIWWLRNWFRRTASAPLMGAGIKAKNRLNIFNLLIKHGSVK